MSTVDRMESVCHMTSATTTSVNVMLALQTANVRPILTTVQAGHVRIMLRVSMGLMIIAVFVHCLALGVSFIVRGRGKI